MEIIIYCKAFIIGIFFTLIIFFTGAVLKDKKPINKVHFYVAKDKNDGRLCLYLGKPRRDCSYFMPVYPGILIGYKSRFYEFGLNPTDFKDLKWEDEPVEVFIKMKN